MSGRCVIATVARVSTERTVIATVARVRSERIYIPTVVHVSSERIFIPTDARLSSKRRVIPKVAHMSSERSVITIVARVSSDHIFNISNHVSSQRNVIPAVVCVTSEHISISAIANSGPCEQQAYFHISSRVSSERIGAYFHISSAAMISWSGTPCDFHIAVATIIASVARVCTIVIRLQQCQLVSEKRAIVTDRSSISC
ncbi:hypothetical protein J6590_060027 [Homalodisca vitripennis]|nr:hypothetical protein J6590_060027 [Homalodisca vitripennis]